MTFFSVQMSEIAATNPFDSSIRGPPRGRLATTGPSYPTRSSIYERDEHSEGNFFFLMLQQNHHFFSH